MGQLWRDVRSAFRMVRTEPAYAATCILILALGIGVTTAIFSILSGVLLAPLPYPDGDRLTMVWLDNRNQGWSEDITSYTNYVDWKERNSVFEQMGAFRTRNYNLTGDGEPTRVPGVAVTTSFFATLGIAPHLGEIFSEAEEQPEADRSVLISHGFWTRKWGADPKVLGSKLTLNSQLFEIVGVMPPSFDFPEDVELWLPLAPSQGMRESRGALWLPVIGSLKKGVALATAQAEMSRIASQLEEEFPDSNQGFGINLQPLYEQIVGEVRPGLLLLMAAVGLVLLIATANLAGLALVRGMRRRQELAVRTVLGASRWLLIRKLLTETLFLSLVSGLLGLGVAYGVLELFLALGPQDLPRLSAIEINSAVVWFALGISLVTGLVVGLIPGIEASGIALNRALKSAGRGLGRGGASQRLRKVLVVSEVALSLVLLAGALLLVRSLLNLQQVDPGFDPANLLSVNLATSGSRYAEGAQRVAFYRQLEERLLAVPGVKSAASTSALFIPLLTNSTTFSIEGRPELPRGQRVEVPVDAVTPGLFSTLGVELLSGRAFDVSDSSESPLVVIINRTMAEQFWPDEDPVGRRIKYGSPDSESPWRTVVGVVADVRRSGLDKEVRPSTFLPHTQSPRSFMTLLVRSELDSALLVPAFRSAVNEIDPDLPIFSVTTVEETLSGSMSQRRFHMALLTFFSVMALLLAVSGLYGVVSYSASQRTREIGVRMALGARPMEIVHLVLREGMTLTLVGIALGLAAALFITRFMESLLFGVSPSDGISLILMGTLVGVAALGACSLPATRASRVDPARALHHD